MQFEKINMNGPLLVKPDVFADERGFFLEMYNRDRYSENGIAEVFVQDNLSKSKINTVRGLHYQVGQHAQGKLCSVISGKVLDVAVDIRFGSPTFGTYFSVELTDENKFQLWIPPGFAHGFSVLSEEAVFSYKCTAVYNKPGERAIIFNDRELNIDWRVINPIVSNKDLEAKSFKAIEKDFVY